MRNKTKNKSDKFKEKKKENIYGEKENRENKRRKNLN